MALDRDLGEINRIGADTRERLVSAQVCPALRDHGMALCGISEAKPGFRFVRHDWNLCQILMTVSGSGRVLVGREWLALQANQAYIQPAHRLHAYQASEAETWTVVWAMWSDVQAVAGDLRVVVAGDAGAMQAAVQGLHGEVHGHAQPVLLAAYAAVIDGLFRRLAQPGEGSTLGPVWSAVSADPGYPWTLDILAESAGMHPEALRRRCLRELGTTPMRRVTSLRLQHAAALLATTQIPVATIAERVGYGDPFAFTTAFTRCFGYPPSQHRLRTQDS